MARHWARVEDLLDSPQARVALLVRPRHAPLSLGAEPPLGRFELSVGLTPPVENVVARFWAHPQSQPPEGTSSVSLRRFDSTWLDARVVDFVRAVLSHA